jgi:hypothetical protein
MFMPVDYGEIVDIKLKEQWEYIYILERKILMDWLDYNDVIEIMVKCLYQHTGFKHIDP